MAPNKFVKSIKRLFGKGKPKKQQQRRDAGLGPKPGGGPVTDVDDRAPLPLHGWRDGKAGGDRGAMTIGARPQWRKGQHGTERGGTTIGRDRSRAVTVFDYQGEGMDAAEQQDSSYDDSLNDSQDSQKSDSQKAESSKTPPEENSKTPPEENSKTPPEENSKTRSSRSDSKSSKTPEPIVPQKHYGKGEHEGQVVDDGSVVAVKEPTLSEKEPDDSGSKSSSTASSTVSTNHESTASEKESVSDHGRNVQAPVPQGRGQTSFMKEQLRKNRSTHHGDGVDENRKAISRERLAKTEEDSKGWALLPMQDKYRGKEDQNGKLGGAGKVTQYFLARGAMLQQRVKDMLGPNLEAGEGRAREDTIITFKEGKWVNSLGKNVDTTAIAAMAQAIHETKTKLETRILGGREKGAKLGKLHDKLKKLQSAKGQRELGIAGRCIFVMNAAGQIFAGRSKPGIIHHSSFLAGGAVAGAGEMEISAGKLKVVSNTSGHYRPGPAYLWQVLKQMELQGVPLGDVRVEVMGVGHPFKSGTEFLAAMDPAANPRLFSDAVALEHLRQNRSTVKKTRESEKLKRLEEESEKKRESQHASGVQT